MKLHRAFLGALGALTLALGSAAHANNTPGATVSAGFSGLSNTGFGANNTLNPLGDPSELDANYFVIKTQGAGTTVVPVNAYNSFDDSPGKFPYPGAWVADNNVSRWASFGSPAGTSYDNSSNGVYVYTTSFNLAAGFLANTASLAGRFLADNRVLSLTLNGTQVSLGDAPPAGKEPFNTWQSFLASAGFVTGSNTLAFTVQNDQFGPANPTGLRVEFTNASVQPVPEPGEWAMILAGLAVVSFVATRRQRVARA